MKVIVTCGPSYEPLDAVRRITNFSTGELGALLSAALARAGHETICLRGVAATHAATPEGAAVRSFTTNDDLTAQLKSLATEGEVTAVFHAAALCDYRVQRIDDAKGMPVGGAKIASRSGALTVQFAPTSKLISHLREWFPRSLLVGWKYELDGSPSEAIGKARRQILENHTDACIVNGSAYGQGFGFVQEEGFRGHLTDKERLCAFLADWMQRRKHPLRSATTSPLEHAA